MKTQKRIIISCSFSLLSFLGTTQNLSTSNWVIDQNNSITCQNIIYTENSDTVIFLNDITLTLEFITLENADKVIYDKRTKNFIIIPIVEKGILKMKDGISIVKYVCQGVMDSGIEWKMDNYMEYTLGEHLLFIR